MIFRKKDVLGEKMFVFWRGAATGSKRIILNTGTYLYTVNLYDDHGRLIQQKQTPMARVLSEASLVTCNSTRIVSVFVDKINANPNWEVKIRGTYF